VTADAFLYVTILRQLLFTPKCLGCSRLGEDFCPSCASEVNPFRAQDLIELDACFCAGNYSGWLRETVISYKNGDIGRGEVLAKLLLITSERFLPDTPITMVPIPSSKTKVSERGFDSISHLCRKLAKAESNLTIETNCLYLQREVLDQVGLSAAQRQVNLAGAFAVRKNLSGTVVIVDDVVTTGATLNSAAKVLKYAGAQRVFALALCGNPKTR